MKKTSKKTNSLPSIKSAKTEAITVEDPHQKIESVSTEEPYTQCTPYKLLSKDQAWEPTPPMVTGRLSINDFLNFKKIMRETVATLYGLANNGDLLAAELLHDYADSSIKLLGSIARSNPEFLHPISKQQLFWPSFIGRKKILKENNESMIRKLELGKESRMNGNWNTKSPATSTALMMLSWLQRNHEILQLKPLSKETQKEWFEAGWKRHLHEIKNHPEFRSFLSNLVKQKEVENESARKQEKRNKETVIQEKIKNRVWTGFLSLTKGSK